MGQNSIGIDTTAHAGWRRKVTGDFRSAQRVLESLRDTSAQAKRELDETRESLNLKIKQSGWSLFKDNSNFRRAVYLGVLVQVMQQFTGMNGSSP
ncbi:sugar (and other) transporter family protein, partial [Candidatus Erwinia dacicola]